MKNDSEEEFLKKREKKKKYNKKIKENIKKKGKVRKERNALQYSTRIVRIKMHSRCARGAQELHTEINVYVLLEHFLCFSVASFTSHFHFTLEPHTDDQKLTHLKCFYTEHEEALLCIIKEAGCAL